MPIEVLQYGVKVRDPTTKQFSDLAALRGADGAAGPGVPAGGADGDVLVKDGATDYDATWKKTPPQMGSLATIEPTSSASKAYAAGDYLVYNGQLYKVTATTISQGETLSPGQGGNIEATIIVDGLTPTMIGETLPAATDCVSGTVTEVLSISLSAGLWVINCCASWQSNANGYRQIAFDDSTKNTARGRSTTMLPMTDTTKEFSQQLIYMEKIDAPVTRKMYALQNSGTTLRCYPYYRAIKLA